MAFSLQSISTRLASKKNLNRLASFRDSPGGRGLDIGDIEPIAGAGFAMCLAYLALDRFRYRTEVEKAAQSALATLDKEGDGTPDPPEAIANNDAMLELKWFARHDCNGFRPQHPWTWVYSAIYRRETDKWTIISLAVLAAFVLLSGVGAKIATWLWSSAITGEGSLGFWFYICLACIVVPPLSVGIGRHVMEWCQRRSKHLESQILILLKDRVSSVVAPPIPPA